MKELRPEPAEMGPPSVQWPSLPYGPRQDRSQVDAAVALRVGRLDGFPFSVWSPFSQHQHSCPRGQFWSKRGPHEDSQLMRDVGCSRLARQKVWAASSVPPMWAPAPLASESPWSLTISRSPAITPMLLWSCCWAGKACVGS